MRKFLRVLMVITTLSISACAPGQQATLAPTVTYTATATNTPVPAPTATPTLTPEQAFQEYKRSRFYHKALQNYLDYFWLKVENVQLQMQTLTLNGQEYRLILAMPDQSQLTEVQKQYQDIYQPVPLFYAVQDEITGAWTWDKEPPLRAFADELGIKVGTTGDLVTSKDADLKKHFNIATVPFINWQLNEPQKGVVNMGDPDKIVRQLLNNNQEVVSGHLTYMSEYPDWLNEGSYSQAELEELVRKHVRDVMTRYKGKINYWVVLNEFHPFDLAHGWYNDYLAERLGWQKLIAIAFDEARKNDPDAPLIVNDFCNYYQGDINNGNKFTQDAAVIKLLRQQGIDHLAIGMQMHVNHDHCETIPNPDRLAKAIKAYQELGVEVYITEMDVNISPQSYNGSIPFPGDDRYLHQAEIYYQILETYFKSTWGQKNQVVISWDFRDENTWLEYMMNYKNPEPLLLDKRGNPKPAYYAYLRALYSLATNHQ